MHITYWHFLASLVANLDKYKERELVDYIEMRKTDCFGKTRLVPHVSSSS